MSKLLKAAAISVLTSTAFSGGIVRAEIITFDAIASAAFQYFPSYSEAGFTLTSSATSATAFGSWGTAYTEYTGSQALFNDKANESTALARVGGGTFSFNAIDLSELYDWFPAPPTTVTFVGYFAGGGTASHAVDLDLVFGKLYVYSTNSNWP